MKTIYNLLEDKQNETKLYNEKIKHINEEIKKIQKYCPHPIELLESTHKDYYDETGSPVYEGSVITVTCKLCGKTSHKDYDKKRDTKHSLSELIREEK